MAPNPPAGGPRQDPLPMLQQLYAGLYSPLTAMLQYRYQSTVLAHCDPQLAQALACMAGVEAHHLEILGALIASLGGTPAYSTQAGPWTGQQIYYGTAPCRILLKDLAQKVEAVDRCLQAAGQLQDPRLSGVLKKLAEDQSAQVQLLQEMIRRRRCRRP